jgi:O-antigen/teichoic acid export membrane protein
MSDRVRARSVTKWGLVPLLERCGVPSLWEKIRDRGGFLFQSRRGAAAVAQTIVTRFLVAGLNFATGIISARTLGTDGRGDMSAMLVWPLLLPYLFTLGLPSAVRYWIRRQPDRRAELFTTAFGGAVLASLVAVLVGVTFVPSWLHGYPPDIIRAAQVVICFSPEIMLGLITTGMLEALGDFRTANVARYATVLLTLIWLLVLAISHRMSPFAGALAYVGAPVIVAFWTAWKLREHFHLRIFDPRPAVKLLGSYGIRSYGIDILNVVSTQVDQVLVIAFLSAADLGVYTVALNASRVVNILHTAVVTVVFPEATGQDKKTVVGMVERAARLSSCIALAFGAALALAFPVIFPFFYGAGFARGVAIGQVLVLEAVLSGLISVLSQAFMALGRPGMVTVLQSIGLAAALPLMYVMLPRFGLIGAAYALLISTTLRLTLVLALYRAVLKVPLPHLVPVAEDFARLRGALAKR